MSNFVARLVLLPIAVALPAAALVWSASHPLDPRLAAAAGIAGVFVSMLAPARPRRVAPPRATESRSLTMSESTSEEDILRSGQLESLGILAGGIAHDFNNLLMGILGNTRVALEGLPRGQVRDAIEEADTAARRARELVSQLVAYSGGGALEVRPIDLPGMVRETRSLLTRVISPRAELDVDAALDLAIEGDPAQIRQVVMNLLTNASDALGGAPGRITVRVGRVRMARRELDRTVFGKDLPAGRYVRLTVQDTGCGMDEETVGRMFEPYFSTKPGGRGLGLAALLGIVRRHRGTLQVDSKPGRGTTMTVWFPAPAHDLAAVTSDPGFHVPEHKHGGRVLLAEDDDLVRRVTQRMLTQWGYDVVAVIDGRKALAEIDRGQDYVFALVDVQMPGVDGRQVVRRLRAERPSMPTVLMTGYAGPEAEGDVQPHAWLRKPFTPRELLMALDAARVSTHEPAHRRSAASGSH